MHARGCYSLSAHAGKFLRFLIMSVHGLASVVLLQCEFGLKSQSFHARMQKCRLSAVLKRGLAEELQQNVSGEESCHPGTAYENRCRRIQADFKRKQEELRLHLRPATAAYLQTRTNSTRKAHG